MAGKPISLKKNESLVRDENGSSGVESDCGSGRENTSHQSVEEVTTHSAVCEVVAFCVHIDWTLLRHSVDQHTLVTATGGKRSKKIAPQKLFFITSLIF